MYEDNVEYAKGRLEGTLVRVGEEPVYVRGVGPVGGKMACRVEFIKDGEEKVVKISDLNLEPVPLGYVNYNSSSYYIVRKPMRRDWKQGLRPGNTAFVGEEGWLGFPNQQLRETILGIYPKAEDAVELVNTKKAKQVAFSRDFAVDSNRHLQYKGRHTIGTFDKVFTLFPKYNYLNEYLQETIDG